MDNAVVIDGVLVIVLIVGTAIGARRGLFKSLMGFVIVLAALFGAVLLADMLTPKAAELVYPAVRDKAVELFSESEAASALDVFGDVSEQLERYGLSGKDIDPYQSAVSAVEQAAQTIIGSLVHTVLVLLLYIALTIVLKLLTNAIDLVFDLPVLSTLNGAGGAVLGLLETALLISVVVYIGSRLGVKLITEHTNDTFVLPLFLGLSPVAWISSLKAAV